jgi:ribosomal protein S18 acetylase RimI-like enzyme
MTHTKPPPASSFVASLPTITQAAHTLALPITIRYAVAEDLPKLEWFGLYQHFRFVYERTFKDQQQGRRLMVVAVLNQFPIGQVFISLEQVRHTRPQDRRIYMYSLRVMEMFHGQGLGTRLIETAEQIGRACHAQAATLSVAQTNAPALRLYQRLGYVIQREEDSRWSYPDHEGRTRFVHEPSYALQKPLLSPPINRA